VPIEAERMPALQSGARRTILNIADTTRHMEKGITLPLSSLRFLKHPLYLFHSLCHTTTNVEVFHNRDFRP
jgi:hypothetical protein